MITLVYKGMTGIRGHNRVLKGVIGFTARVYICVIDQA